MTVLSCQKCRALITRPNEFGSMTARKDNSSPIKSIFCHKRSIKRPCKTIKGIQDHEKAAQYHERSCKNIKGHTRQQQFARGCARKQFSLRIFFVPFATFLFDLEQNLFASIFCSHRDVLSKNGHKFHVILSSRNNCSFAVKFFMIAAITLPYVFTNFHKFLSSSS